MVTSKYAYVMLISISLSFLAGCKKTEIEKPLATVSDNFESGSIGEVVKTADNEWELYIADDNNDPGLPDNWRDWWYVKMDNVDVETFTEITLKNRGWPFYYLPVYSYDQQQWHRFMEEEVSLNQDDELIMRKRFDQETVWIARFYPYTFTDLENYIGNIKANPTVSIQTPGFSQNGKAVYLLKISNFNIPNSTKKRIFIHARTHPAEVPSSFLIEGMINFLVSGTAEAADILSGFEFYIFPMQNVDGVQAGNYRSTPQSENLEVMWYYQGDRTIDLTADAPPEVAVVHRYAKDLMTDGGPAVSMALNLHASNSEPDIRPFFFPHFGTEAQGYSPVEASLWDKQIKFIRTVATHYGADMLEPLPEEGGGSFAAKTYPESWWWVNFKDQVMAITMEMTYGRAGYSPRWIEPDDLRDLGSALVLSIRDYYDGSFIPAPMRTDKGRKAALKYSRLYPPDDADEMKK
jgi:hypothetical protein